MIPFVLLAITTSVHAQRPTVPGGGTPPGTPQQTAPAAGGPGGFGQRVSTAPKPYAEVITDKAITKRGLVTVHRVDDKWYFEIPANVFNKEIMAITRFSKVAGGGGVYGGEVANQQTIKWERGPSNTIFLRDVTSISVADSTSDIYKAVTNSYLNPIAAAFPVAAYNKDSNSVVIEVTDFFKGDNQVVSISPASKRRLNLSALASDRSYIQDITTYPINTEIKTVKTFTSTPTQGFGGAPSPIPQANLPAANAAGAVTVEMNTSMILLPSAPMARRFFDPRVGFFAENYTVYGDEQQKVGEETFITRWRLEPKDADVEKWKRGELVEPKKQIVYYIDPATPKKWRPYLIAGVNDWQKAFEQAGFKNAIVAKEWPNDPNMSLEDARFSVIRYFASDIENAYGPNVHDPRSGEILESHIGWYHNVMKLVHDWYMIQAAAIDPRARKMEYDDELMGNLIRFVSSHEVGHTLGLRHNWGSSSKTPVENLRNKAWVEANGHTASIMDYARFNYIAQPEDNISETGIFPRIGDYDKWAIEWGYKPTNAVTPKEDAKITNKWIIDRLGKNPRLWFGTEQHPTDPRSQNEDLGDNAMRASEYGIKNLKRILVSLPEWTKEEGNKYDNLENMYGQLTGQFNRYMGHVLKNVGGIYETPKSIEQTGDVYEPTPKAMQKDAVAFLNKQLFETPTWLIDKNITNKFSNPASADAIGTIQTNTLNNLLSAQRLNRIVSSTNRFGSSTYSVDELLDDTRNGVWSELKTKKTIEGNRRNLQKAYVEALDRILNPPAAGQTVVVQGGRGGASGGSSNAEMTDVSSVVRAHLIQLRSEINAAIPGTTDKMSKYHLMDVSERIKRILDPKA
ncbi:MAG: zinc-dependent metalloprotease [Chitinophagaceae bacterium]|nr:zinc-dependent metalloprotease [Chitinophagaceae bacterium]